MAVLTPIRIRPTMGNNTSFCSKGIRNSSTPASSVYPLQKVTEGDEHQTDDEGGPPDQASTSASEASDNSKNSQPPLLDFLDAACSASTWFTSCFPCAVVDINNNCDDNLVAKLDRSNAMSLMYGMPLAEVPNSFELKPGEKDEGGTDNNRDGFQRQEYHDTNEGTAYGVNQFSAEPETKPETEPELVSETCEDAPTQDLQSTYHQDTPISPSRKRFNISSMKPNASGVKKLFKRRHQ